MIEIQVTCKDDKEAERIADALLSKRLVACANYFPVRSIYFWKAKVEKGSEMMLILKTTMKKQKLAVASIKAHHSYELPVIIINKVKTTKKVKNWINQATK